MSTSAALPIPPTAEGTDDTIMIGTSIPKAPPIFVQTPGAREVALGVWFAVSTGHICLVDGPRGVGKTTAVVEVARQAKDLQPVYVNFVDVRTPREAMALIWEALTSEPARTRATAQSIRDDLARELRRRKVLLIIDDAHTLSVQSLRTINTLWNRTHAATGGGLPIVLIGNHLARHLSGCIPEMYSRAGMCVEVPELGGKALLDLLFAMRPGIATTNPEVLLTVNRNHLKGRVRKWVQFFDLLALVRQQSELTGAIDTAEANKILKRMATPTREDA